MKNKTIRVSVVCGRLFYNLDDLVEALGYSNAEAALCTIPDTSVCKIVCGDASPCYYVDVVGMCNLISDCEVQGIPKDWLSTCEIITPQSNLLEGKMNHYPNSLVLNIYTDKHSDVIQTSNLCEEALYSITEIAEEFDLSAKELNLFLAMKGIQYKKNNTWHLYKKYLKKGYVGYKKHKLGHMYWTTDGMLFIITMLEKAGYKRIHDDR